METLEQIAMELGRLRNRVLETRAAIQNVSAEILHPVATDALKKATGLGALLVTSIRGMPLH